LVAGGLFGEAVQSMMDYKSCDIPDWRSSYSLAVNDDPLKNLFTSKLWPDRSPYSTMAGYVIGFGKGFDDVD